MRWNYHAPQTYGNQKAMDWFINNDLQVMGATAGQTRWTLMPLRESNIQNIKTFAINSIKGNLSGLLLTLWDDDSPHFELYREELVPLQSILGREIKYLKMNIKACLYIAPLGHNGKMKILTLSIL